MDEESHFVLSNLSYLAISTEVSNKFDNIMKIPFVFSSFHTVRVSSDTQGGVKNSKQTSTTTAI